MTHTNHAIVAMVTITAISIFVGIVVVPSVNMTISEKSNGVTSIEDISAGWKVENMSPKGELYIYVITDPTNSQKWLAVSRGVNSMAILPYVPTQVRVEKETK